MQAGRLLTEKSLKHLQPPLKLWDLVLEDCGVTSKSKLKPVPEVNTCDVPSLSLLLDPLERTPQASAG